MDPEVRGFYVDDFREDERLRLRAHGVLERVRTQELLARFLPPPPATVAAARASRQTGWRSAGTPCT
jgi:hypothetical protein